MSRGWHWKKHDWKIECDVCSKEIYASDAKHRWDGLIVCKDDFEVRHPQELIRIRSERTAVPFISQEPPDVFVTVNYVVSLGCTPSTSTGEADICTADCARADIRLMNDLVI